MKIKTIAIITLAGITTALGINAIIERRKIKALEKEISEIDKQSEYISEAISESKNASLKIKSLIELIQKIGNKTPVKKQDNKHSEKTTVKETETKKNKTEESKK